MIETVDHDKFLGEAKERLCVADCHKRYYQMQAVIYRRVDYWARVILGILGAVGALVAATDFGFKTLGVIVAGGTAFLLGTCIPLTKWDKIVADLNEAEKEWTIIFKGYEELICFAEIANRDEMLMAEFQRIKDLQKATATTDKMLPKNEKLWKQADEETRRFYEE